MFSCRPSHCQLLARTQFLLFSNRQSVIIALPRRLIAWSASDIVQNRNAIYPSQSMPPPVKRQCVAVIRPLRPIWLFFTYVVPVIPVFIFWDGVVSCLRVYSPKQLEELVAPLREEFPTYTWEVGRIRLGMAPAYATSLIGMPKLAQGDEMALASEG